MSDGDLLLGIDLGTSAVKVLAVDASGAVKASGTAEYPVLHLHAGWAEQDPDAWWSATVAATQQAVGWGIRPEQIRAIAFSGQMHGVSFLGEGSRALYPAVIWADQRSEKQVGELTRKVGAERLIEIAGSPVAAGFMAATVRWMQEEKASIWWRTRHLLSPKDEIRRRMTGAIASDPGDGAATLLFDARWRNWSPQLLDAAEVPSALMPAIRPSGAPAGELTAEAAEALGLRAGTLVVTGSADTACSLLGAGIVDSETLLLSLSTGAQVMTPQEAFAPDLSGRTHTFCSALEPGAGSPGWYQMGATLAAGMAMRWLRDEVLRLHPAGAYERMTALAEGAPPGARGALFLPYLVGERTPHMDAGVRGAFLGLTAQHTAGDMVRAVMEGVTFACYDAYLVLRDTGARPERIVLAGGGARSPLWRQIIADVFGLPVYALATVDQAAMGAALLAGTGAGMLSPVEASTQWAQYGARSDPDMHRHRRYGELSELFRETYAPVAEMSHKLRDWAAAGEPPRVTPRTIRKSN
ncbi:MAG: xylulokinase [Thermomicrobiales bacterium]